MHTGPFRKTYLPVRIVWQLFPGGWKIAPWSSKNRLLEASGGVLDARWTLLCSQGRSDADFRRLWGALGAFLAVLWAVLKPLEPLLGRPGRLLGTVFDTSQGLILAFWTISVALREMQQKPCILQCFWASRASRRGPKSLQNHPGGPLGRLLGPKIGLEGPS